jgi:hypothetical protein
VCHFPQHECAPSVEDKEDGIRHASKTTRCQRSEEVKKAHRDKVSKLYSKPIGKWPEKEYARLRQSNPYLMPNSDMCVEEFWNPTQHKIYDDLYAEKAYRVAPMHSINYAHMNKHVAYFAEAREICEEFWLLKFVNFSHPYHEDIISQFFATVYIDTDDDDYDLDKKGRRLSGTWAQFASCLDYPVL